MEKRYVYVVLADPVDQNSDFLLCGVFDRKSLADSVCEDVALMSDQFSRVFVDKFPLNCFVAW